MTEINGIRLTGNYQSICIKNGKVFVNGKPLIEGELKEDTVFNGNIIIEGTVKSVDAVNVTVNGHVFGDIDATTVNVEGNVSGSIDGTTVQVGGDVGGDVDATTVKVFRKQ